jgi:molybdopterin synthase catalytic subunit
MFVREQGVARAGTRRRRGPRSTPRVGKRNQRHGLVGIALPTDRAAHRRAAKVAVPWSARGSGLQWLVVQPPSLGDTWLGIAEAELPVAAAYDWALHPSCGAVVLFSGTVRDHAVDEGGVVRSNVGWLTYEAYDNQVIPKFQAIVDELRQRWPHTGRVAMLHRLGRIDLGDSSVIVVVSAPHRPQAFEAARYAIDALKATAPIWKHEEYEGGAGWGTGAQAPVDAAAVQTAQFEAT